MTGIAKAVVTFLCLALSCVPCLAQCSPTRDLYVVALEASLNQMEHEWGAIDNSEGGKQVRTDYRNVVIMIDSVTPGDMPTQVGSSRVAYLDHDALVQRAIRLGKPFPILTLVPLRVDGSSLVVTYRVHWVTVRKGMLSLGLSDWSTVYFRFDCENDRFVVDRVKLGGI